ncbi:hypothetical protein MRB53_022963 [Persea americana]|uniref:Uncharacterized protein n=1 Tax=Persea americana TaxID=3435 RepID=A0ACC2L868_PERAE|nr:hypothetical protein MRB53_022963 [Persea americana]
MTTEKSESSSSSPVFHIQSENSGFNAGITLTESNYDVWSQILEMQIAKREKLEYIIGNTPQPKETDVSYVKWYAENQKVKRWLLTSMAPEIMKRYLRLRTACEIWNALAKAFYDGSDESQIFALNQRAFSTKQVGRSLPTYYGDLVEIFQELDHRDKIVMKDPDDVIAYKKSVERLRVHICLNGLDAEFDQLRGEILGKDPVLDFEDTYAYVRRDAIRRTVLNGEFDQSESSAMVARRSNPKQWRTNPKQERPSGSPNLITDQTRSSGSQNRSYEIGAARPERICTHCGENEHTKARCYELIGFPEWWDPAKAPRKRNSKSNHHASVAVAEPSNTTPKEASSLIATSGTLGKALNTSASNSSSTWIIDSGATDHMTFDVNHIHSMKPSEQPVVSTANGTPSSVIGEGSITLTKGLNLNSVLVVPSLHYNLLSVAQKGYRCYHPTSRKEYVTLDVVFHEEEMYYSAPESPLQGESRNELESLDELETLNYSFVTSDSTNGDNLDNSGEGINETSGHILDDGNSLDQIEEDLPPPVPASPCQSVPLNQLLSQSDSIPKSQVFGREGSSPEGTGGG